MSDPSIEETIARLQPALAPTLFTPEEKHQFLYNVCVLYNRHLANLAFLTGMRGERHDGTGEIKSFVAIVSVTSNQSLFTVPFQLLFLSPPSPPTMAHAHAFRALKQGIEREIGRRLCFNANGVKPSKSPATSSFSSAPRGPSNPTSTLTQSTSKPSNPQSTTTSIVSSAKSHSQAKTTAPNPFAGLAPSNIADIYHFGSHLETGGPSTSSKPLAASANNPVISGPLAHPDSSPINASGAQNQTSSLPIAPATVSAQSPGSMVEGLLGCSDLSAALPASPRQEFSKPAIHAFEKLTVPTTKTVHFDGMGDDVPTFAPWIELEPAGVVSYQTIIARDPYSGFSFEELRLADFTHEETAGDFTASAEDNASDDGYTSAV